LKAKKVNQIVKSIITGILLCVAADWAMAADEPALVPVPQKMERLEGLFQVSPGMRIYTDRASSETGKLLVGY